MNINHYQKNKKRKNLFNRKEAEKMIKFIENTPGIIPVIVIRSIILLLLVGILIKYLIRKYI